MHQALQIAEILEIILKYTDPPTTASCARVCRTWHEPALDGVWYDVHRLDALFRLLGPMEKNGDGQHCFTQPHISPERWDKFSFFAKRTRKLKCSRYPNRLGLIHPQTLATIAISRPFLYLLPNLTHITWRHYAAMSSTALMLSILFMSPNLKSIVVQSMWDEDENKFLNHEFLYHIAARSSHIQHLSLVSEGPTSEELGAALTSTIRTLHSLRSVSLSDTFLTNNVLKALSACPHLEVISREDSLYYHLETTFPAVHDGTFPNLKELHIRASLTNMIIFLRPSFLAVRLQWLSICALIQESRTTVTGFLETIGNNCPNIQSLDLIVRYIDRECIHEPLPFAALEPLLGCKSLTSLSIDTPLLLDLDNAHIALMAATWPHLRKLHLTPQPWPHVSHRIRTTFEVLPIVSQLLPKIEHLGIYIHPTIPIEPCSPFPNLQKLVLGSNTMEYNADDVAFFLTEAMPSTCTIAVEYLWAQVQTIPYDLVLESGLDHCAKHLELAISRVPMMRKVDGLYRERIRTLKGEIQRLTASLN